MLPAGHAPPAGDARRAVLLDFGETVDALDGAYLHGRGRRAPPTATWR